MSKVNKILKKDLGRDFLIFADILTANIVELSITKAQIAKALRVTRPTLDSWINGESLPSPENIEKVCEYFDIPDHEMVKALVVEEIIRKETKRYGLIQGYKLTRCG